MEEDSPFKLNDTYHAIERVIDAVRAWESPRCDGRAKALVLTNLEQAQLWSLKMVKPDTPPDA